MNFKKGYYCLTAHTHQLHYISEEVIDDHPNYLDGPLIERWWYVSVEEEYDKMISDVTYATNRRYFMNQK